jgi:alanyl aminopeptidase
VNAYLTRYSYKNATVADFLDSVASAGRPELPRAFSTFLEQPGFPEISVELNCNGAARVKLSQRRYLPIGSTGGESQLWRTPVCGRYQTASGPQNECFLLDTASAEFPLSKTDSCPAYLSANDHAAGYYVAVYGDDLLSKLEQHADTLSAAERVTLLHDLKAAVDAGHGKIGTALQAAQTFSNAPERAVSGQAQTLVAGVRKLVPLELLPNYERYVRKLFAARAEELGWSAKPGDDDETRLQRVALVPFVASQGENATLQAVARRLATGWLTNHKGVDADMLSPVLTTAAWSGGQDLFDTMLHALKSTQDTQQRRMILGGLGSFRDPKIARQALALWLDPDLDMRDTFIPLARAALGDRRTEKLPYEFLQANYDAVVKRLPSSATFDYRAALPSLGASLCDEPSRQEFVSFFQDRVKDYVGGPRNYANALESIRLCEARQSAQGSDVAQFFSKQ